MLQIWVTVFVLCISAVATGKEPSSRWHPCRLAWGPAKIRASSTDCMVEVKKSTGPSLLRWTLPAGGLTVDTLLSFELTISSLKSLHGLEMRLYKNAESADFISAKLPLFAEESFNWVQSRVPTPVTLSLTHFLEGKTTDVSSYRHLGFFINTKELQPIEINFRKMTLIKKRFPGAGFVSITFDDGYESLKVADKILRSGKMRATAYVIREALGRKGYITTKEMCAMASGAWAISSHATVPFTDNPDLADFLRKDFAEMKRECNGGLSPQHLAYPLGQQSEPVVDIVKTQYLTARLAGSGLETLPPAMNLKLRAVNVTASMTPENIAQLARQSVANGDWLILMFHYIKSGASPLTDLDYAEENFEKLIKELAPIRAQVLTVPEVYHKYTP